MSQKSPWYRLNIGRAVALGMLIGWCLGFAGGAIAVGVVLVLL